MRIRWFQHKARLSDNYVVENENVWNGNWKYFARDGTIELISALRK